MKYISSLITFCVLCINATQAQEALFNGVSLKGWRTYQHRPADSWFVRDSMICNKGNGDPATRHADLVTEKEYENFELSIDWKIAPQSNSGILYMVSEDYPSAYLSGPEYQIIDDLGYPAPLEDWQHTGANYAMNAPDPVNCGHIAGEWNHTVIIVNRGHIEHWLNNEKVVDYDLYTDAWNQHRLAGKWKDANAYGMYRKGRIALQDHGGAVCFKNITIREL